MASHSNALGKQARVAQRRAAAQALRDAAFWTESVMTEWMALRTKMFAWLEERNIAYHGTRDAIVLTLRQLGPSEAATDLIFLYHVATLAEWDEDFAINEYQAIEVQHIGGRIEQAMLTESGATNEA